MYIIVKKNYGFATYKTDISGQDDDATYNETERQYNNDEQVQVKMEDEGNPRI